MTTGVHVACKPFHQLSLCPDQTHFACWLERACLVQCQQRWAMEHVLR